MNSPDSDPGVDVLGVVDDRNQELVLDGSIRDNKTVFARDVCWTKNCVRVKFNLWLELFIPFKSGFVCNYCISVA